MIDQLMVMSTVRTCCRCVTDVQRLIHC